MPISPKFTWDETEQALEVVVHLPGASRAKSDVFATECMLKVNSATYLLLIDLHEDVDDALSVATLTADGVMFKLFKRVPGFWGRLTREAGSKEELLARRNASIDRAHARLEEARLARLERKQKSERAAIDRQIDIERKKRLEIDRRKGEELDAERGGIQAWQKQLQQQQQLQLQQGNESDYESEEDGAPNCSGQHSKQAPMPDHEHYYGRGWKPSSSRPKQAATQDLADQGTAIAAGANGTDEEEDARHKTCGQDMARRTLQPDTWADVHQANCRGTEGWHGVVGGGEGGDAEHLPPARPEVVFKPLPPPRMRLEPVRVEFTKLETPHLPARAQREEELRTYKAKLVDEKLLADSQDVADRQPVFLKDKGDALYKQANYRGALNAYSRAIELDDTIPLLWANRGACHLVLGDHEAAVGDCTRALDLLLTRQDRYESGTMDPPDMAAFRRQLVRVHVRRGQALAQLGSLAQALQDYEHAMRLDPDNASLAADVEELRAALGPADAAALKQRGAARFAAGDHAGAVEAWGLLLGLPRSAEVMPEPERQAALSNRAAALLVLGRYAEGEADCCAALALALAALHSRAGQLQPLPGQPLQTQEGQQPYRQGDTPHSSTLSAASMPLPPPAHPSARPSTAPQGDPGLLAAAAAAAATATQGPLAHTASSMEAAESALHAYMHTLLPPSSQQQQQQQQQQQEGLLEQHDHGQQQQALSSAHSTSCQGVQQQEQQCTCKGSLVTMAASLLPIARLLARRGALRGHMRMYSCAHKDCCLASQLFSALQEHEKAKQLEADACKLQHFIEAEKKAEHNVPTHRLNEGAEA